MKRLRNIFLFVTLMFGVTLSMAQEPKVSLDFDNGKTATETLKKYVTALQNADAEGVAALMTKDAMVYGLGGGLDSLNATQHKAYWVNSLTNYKHNISNDLYLPVKVENNWNEGEWLLTWGVNTLENNKTGIVTPVPYHIASLVVDGKITTMRYYLDYISLLTKQGYSVTPPTE
ncbi:nuclear transport factor 2 family protein [uncultured Maribacter sp.]|uniref:nuclear transport factor 2 family protein n=1 Tax=uncultured Maribacter sp. TaxID=431308 RepID=UPI0030DA4580